MHRLVTKTATRKVVDRVGRRGHFRPILEVIFPDWIDEQRDLAIRSLKGWADANLANLPAPFPVTEAEIAEFCVWLEAAGLYLYPNRAPYRVPYQTRMNGFIGEKKGKLGGSVGKEWGWTIKSNSEGYLSTAF